MSYHKSRNDGIDEMSSRNMRSSAHRNNSSSTVSDRGNSRGTRSSCYFGGDNNRGTRSSCYFGGKGNEGDKVYLVHNNNVLGTDAELLFFTLLNNFNKIPKEILHHNLEIAVPYKHPKNTEPNHECSLVLVYNSLHICITDKSANDCKVNNGGLSLYFKTKVSGDFNSHTCKYDRIRVIQLQETNSLEDLHQYLNKSYVDEEQVNKINESSVRAAKNVQTQVTDKVVKEHEQNPDVEKTIGILDDILAKVQTKATVSKMKHITNSVAYAELPSQNTMAAADAVVRHVMVGGRYEGQTAVMVPGAESIPANSSSLASSTNKATIGPSGIQTNVTAPEPAVAIDGKVSILPAGKIEEFETKIAELGNEFKNLLQNSKKSAEQTIGKSTDYIKSTANQTADYVKSATDKTANSVKSAADKMKTPAENTNTGNLLDHFKNWLTEFSDKLSVMLSSNQKIPTA